MNTWSGDWPIPKTIKLPGCRVRVRLVESSVLDGCEGAAVYSHAKNECLILIDQTLPLATQRYVLIHELQHVMVEVVDIMLEHYPQHVQLARASETRDAT